MVAFVVLLSGCATYHIRTTGFLNKESSYAQLSEGSSFAVLVNQNAENPIFDKEVKSKIENKLAAQNGINLARNLLSSLGIEKNEGEKKKDFEKRVLQNTLHLLGLEEVEQ